MFNASILELQSQINYHQEQIEVSEQELDRLKMTQAFAEEAVDKVDEAINSIDPKYLDVFKKHLISLFPTEAPLYLEEDPELVTTQEIEKEHEEYFYPVSRHNPFKPIPLSEYKDGDRPVNMVEISKEMIYVPVDKTAYIAMRAKGRARAYGDYLTRILTVGSKYLVTDKLTKISDSKYEFRIFDISFEDVKHLAKFKLHRDYDHPDNREARELWNSTKKREVPPAYKPSPKPVPLAELKVGEIVSRGSHDKQYKVLSTQELQGTLHAEVVCIYNSEMPALVNQKSYFKEVYRVLTDDIQYSDSFQHEQEENLEFPSGPYEPIDVADVELADIVTTSPNAQAYYEVTSNKGDYLLAKCLYHSSLKHREGEDGYCIKSPFLVEREDSYIEITTPKAA